MLVEDLMTREVHSCGPNDSLYTAARIMWDHDCGCVPVVDAAGSAIAMITDRDICMAAYTQGRLLTEAVVSSAASRGVVVVHPYDTLDAAERVMQMNRVRRVPVVDDAGCPVGILSLNDIARKGDTRGMRADALSCENVARTLAAVSQPTPAR